jgi:predicted NBD/HSP70 family sugar kinase
MSGALHIGIDISGRENLAQFMDADGNKARTSLSFSNDQEGLEIFLDEVTLLAQKYRPDVVNIGMEATEF